MYLDYFGMQPLKQAVPGRTHKGYFPVAQPSRPTYLVLVSCLGNLNL